MANELHRLRLEATKPDETILNRRVLLSRAFRSNNYLQGRRVLRNQENCFCPLGVMADVFNHETKQGEWTRDEKGWRFDRSRFYPSPAAATYFGMSRHGAFYVPNDNNVHTFPEMNDERGWAFGDFATLLEDPRILWVQDSGVPALSVA